MRSWRRFYPTAPALKTQSRSGERAARGHRCGLPARWAIHTVGPVWCHGRHGEDELLASCYRNSLALAAARGLKTIAFPSISTGACGFPIERAARIAVRECRAFLAAHPEFGQIRLVCGAAALATYQAALRENTTRAVG